MEKSQVELKEQLEKLLKVNAPRLEWTVEMDESSEQSVYYRMGRVLVHYSCVVNGERCNGIFAVTGPEVELVHLEDLARHVAHDSAFKIASWLTGYKFR